MRGYIWKDRREAVFLFVQNFRECPPLALSGHSQATA